MKLSLNLLALTAPLAASQCLIEEDGLIEFEIKDCTYENVLQRIKKLRNILRSEGASNCLDPVGELGALLGLGDDEDAMKEKIDSICEEAIEQSVDNGEYVVDYADIPLDIDIDDREGVNRFLKEFYDGGTFYNEEIQQENHSGIGNYNLQQSTRGIRQFNNNEAKNNIVDWPSSSISNFRECDINAVMCCWVQDRQADDDNGNCNTPYPSVKIGSADLWTPSSCIDKDPADNTDICYVDMSRSPESNHVVEGGIIYDNKNGVREGNAHCHGFAWADEELSFSNRFKGNNLFYVSMYDHLQQRGYVREVPGAPMCGCVEQMPTVTRSDCTEMEITETFAFRYIGGLSTFDAAVTSAHVEFNACQGLNGNNNDLKAKYEKLVSDGDINPDNSEENIDDFLVGRNNCGPAITSFLDTFGIESQ